MTDSFNIEEQEAREALLSLAVALDNFGMASQELSDRERYVEGKSPAQSAGNTGVGAAFLALTAVHEAADALGLTGEDVIEAMRVARGDSDLSIEDFGL